MKRYWILFTATTHCTSYKFDTMLQSDLCNEISNLYDMHTRHLVVSTLVLNK